MISSGFCGCFQTISVGLFLKRKKKEIQTFQTSDQGTITDLVFTVTQLLISTDWLSIYFILYNYNSTKDYVMNLTDSK